MSMMPPHSENYPLVGCAMAEPRGILDAMTVMLSPEQRRTIQRLFGIMLDAILDGQAPSAGPPAGSAPLIDAEFEELPAAEADPVSLPLSAQGRDDCESDILDLLENAEHHLLTKEIVRALGRRHGESTVKRALSRLVQRGLLVNRRTKPRGYAPLHWRNSGPQALE